MPLQGSPPKRSVRDDRLLPWRGRDNDGKPPRKMMASSRQGLTSALRGVSTGLNGRTQQPLEQQFRSLRLTPSVAVVPGKRCLSTESGPPEDQPSFQAAPEVDVARMAGQLRLAKHARPVPLSRSYFSRTPMFNDRFLVLDRLSKLYSNLPRLPGADAERVLWKSLPDLRQSFGEPVKASEYFQSLALLKSLHLIHPDLKPESVTRAMEDFKRDVQAESNRPSPIQIDASGRALGVGRRKASTARAFVVEGEGQVLVNGKTLAGYFGRVHDRESAVWALHSTDRLDKYNVWARVEGGGTTGQAEALTLAIAKALMAHEPALKPALRRCKWKLPRLLIASMRTLLTYLVPSRLRYPRPEDSGEEEARPSKGEKGHDMGQEIVWAGQAVVVALWICMGGNRPGTITTHGSPSVSFLLYQVNCG